MVVVADDKRQALAWSRSRTSWRDRGRHPRRAGRGRARGAPTENGDAIVRGNVRVSDVNHMLVRRCLRGRAHDGRAGPRAVARALSEGDEVAARRRSAGDESLVGSRLWSVRVGRRAEAGGRVIRPHSRRILGVVFSGAETVVLSAQRLRYGTAKEAEREGGRRRAWRLIRRGSGHDPGRQLLANVFAASLATLWWRGASPRCGSRCSSWRRSCCW
jgi:hypothetical protein